MLHALPGDIRPSYQCVSPFYATWPMRGTALPRYTGSSERGTYTAVDALNRSPGKGSASPGQRVRKGAPLRALGSKPATPTRPAGESCPEVCEPPERVEGYHSLQGVPRPLALRPRL